MQSRLLSSEAPVDDATSAGASFRRAINVMGSETAKTGLTVQIPELWLLLSLPALLGATPTSGTFAAPGVPSGGVSGGSRPCSAHSLQRLHMKGAWPSAGTCPVQVQHQHTMERGPEFSAHMIPPPHLAVYNFQEFTQKLIQGFTSFFSSLVSL